MRPKLMTRWILTTLLTVSVPLCCCQGQQFLSLLISAAAGHTSTPASAGAVGMAGHHSSTTASHGDDSAHTDAADHCKDGRCNRSGKCKCGHVKVLATAPGNSTVTVSLASSTLFYALPVRIGLPRVRVASYLIRANDEGASRSPTSLLRLHCALQV